MMTLQPWYPSAAACITSDVIAAAKLRAQSMYFAQMGSRVVEQRCP
jgi:hypothetical protein